MATITPNYNKRLFELLTAISPITRVSIGTVGQSNTVVCVPAANGAQQTAINTFDWGAAAQDQWEAEDASKNVLFTKSVRLQADRTTNTNPGYADCTGLSFQLAANTHYAFTFDGAYTASVATTGIQLALNGPTNSFLAIGLEVAESATAWRSICSSAFNSGVDGLNSGGATLLPWHIFGNISTTAAGLLIVRFRSETNGNNVTIKRGSFGELKAIE